MLALGGRHRRDDRLGLLEDVVRNVDVLEHLAHARDHRGEVLQVAHLLDLLNLGDEVVEVELVLDELLLQPARLLLVELLLRPLHERHDVAHAEDAVGHALRVEDLQRIHLLAAGDKLQRFVHHRADRDRRTAARVAVELREHHAVEVEPFVELARRVHGILTRHGVDDEERLRRLDRRLDGRDLLHHRLVDGQTSRRIDDHDVESVLAGIPDGVLRDLHGVFVPLLGVDLDADLAAEDLQLVDGRRTVDVARNEQHLTSLLRLDVGRELAREGRLARALETGDEDDGRRPFEADVRGRAAHELGQLVAHDLGEHLPGFHGFQHVLTQRLLLHRVGEGLGHLVVDVGVDERPADLLERLGDVDLGDAPFALEYLERPFEFVD